MDKEITVKFNGGREGTKPFAARRRAMVETNGGPRSCRDAERLRSAYELGPGPHKGDFKRYPASAEASHV